MASSSVDCNISTKYRFLLKPDEALKCLICLDVAEEPWQHVDCGMLFCTKCLEKYGKKKPCRNCGKKQPQYFPDSKSKREIKALRVKCQKGCSWQGTISTLQEHASTCQFVLLLCPNKCNSEIARKDLDGHLEKHCPNRDIECQYCRERGTYATITTVHEKACKKKMIPCSNARCSELIPRQDLEDHVKYNCDYTLITCKYRSIGCEVELKRKDMAAHELDDKLHLHMAINTITEMKKTSNILLKHKEPMTFQITKYSVRKERKEKINSLTFCSSLGCPLAIAVPLDGIGSGEGTHISIALVIMEENNFFHGFATFTLLNQLEDKNHHSRKLQSMVNEEVMGFVDFIQHSALNYDPVKNTQYLKDDTLYFRVTLEENYPKSWLECTARMIS